MQNFSFQLAAQLCHIYPITAYQVQTQIDILPLFSFSFWIQAYFNICLAYLGPARLLSSKEISTLPDY